MKNYKIAVAGTGYVGLSLSVLLAQHNQVMAVDIVQAKVDMMHGTTEFIHFDMIQDERQIRNRLAQYHLLRDHIDRSQRILCGMEKGLLLTQKVLRVDRLRNSDLVLRKGANWFSITGNCAKYVASKAKWIEDHFKWCLFNLFMELFFRRFFIKHSGL